MLVVTWTAAHCARTLHGSSLAGSESGDCDGARESGAASQETVRRQRVEISGDTLRGGGSSTSGGRDGQEDGLDIWDIGRKRDI